MRISRHFFNRMAHGQMEYLQRTQQIALGEDSEADRAMTALRAFGIGYASPLAVIKRGPFHYEVITELPDPQQGSKT